MTAASTLARCSLRWADEIDVHHLPKGRADDGGDEYHPPHEIVDAQRQRPCAGGFLAWGLSALTARPFKTTRQDIVDVRATHRALHLRDTSQLAKLP